MNFAACKNLIGFLTLTRKNNNVTLLSGFKSLPYCSRSVAVNNYFLTVFADTCNYFFDYRVGIFAY